MSSLDVIPPALKPLAREARHLGWRWSVMADKETLRFHHPAAAWIVTAPPDRQDEATLRNALRESLAEGGKRSQETVT